jgi:hypothetical protein
MSVPRRCPISLSLFSLAHRPLPLGPASPRFHPSVALTPSPTSPTPAALPCSRGNGATRAQRTAAIAGHPKLPTTAPGPRPLLLLQPPRGRAHADPRFFLSAPRHRAAFQKHHPPPHAPFPPILLSSTPEPQESSTASPSRRPRRSPEHRRPVIHQDLTGTTTLFPFLGVPSSEPLLSQSTTLTHLSLSL